MHVCAGPLWPSGFALKLLAPLRCGSNPMRGSCQLLTEGCWFTPRNNLFLQLLKLTAIFNQTWLKNGVKHQFTLPHLIFSGPNLDDEDDDEPKAGPSSASNSHRKAKTAQQRAGEAMIRHLVDQVNGDCYSFRYSNSV